MYYLIFKNDKFKIVDGNAVEVVKNAPETTVYMYQDDTKYLNFFSEIDIIDKNEDYNILLLENSEKLI